MKHRRLSIALYLAAFVGLCDQISKMWVVTQVEPPPEGVFVTSFFNIVLVWNKGVTFGLLNQIDHHYVTYGLIAVAAVIIALLGRWLWQTQFLVVAIAIGAIMGGAIGNVIDRIRYGKVVDFLDFHYHSYHWYAFNVADAAVVTGVCLLMLDSLVRGR